MAKTYVTIASATDQSWQSMPTSTNNPFQDGQVFTVTGWTGVDLFENSVGDNGVVTKKQLNTRGPLPVLITDFKIGEEDIEENGQTVKRDVFAHIFMSSFSKNFVKSDGTIVRPKGTVYDTVRKVIPAGKTNEQYLNEVFAALKGRKIRATIDWFATLSRPDKDNKRYEYSKALMNLDFID